MSDRHPPPDEPVEEGAEPEHEPIGPADRAIAADTGPGIPWRLALFLILIVLVVIFAVQNTQDVELRLFAWSWQLPLVIVILIAVVISIVLDQILGGMVKRSRARRARERHELRRLRGND